MALCTFGPEYQQEWRKYEHQSSHDGRIRSAGRGGDSIGHSQRATLATGDSVRFVGAMRSADTGSVLLARIAQKGSQAIAIRSVQGFLLATGATRSLSNEQRAQAPQNVSAR